METRTEERPELIERSRPPDRVTFTAWEPVFGKERMRQVATDVRGVLFPYVHAYTEVKDEPIIGYQRKRMEFWYEGTETFGRWEWEHAATPEG